MEEQIHEFVERQPAVSTRHLAAFMGTSHASVHHTLQEQQLYATCIQSFQELVPRDAPARHAWCQWILQQLAKDPMFTVNVLFMDELRFTVTGITNIHSEHVWADKSHYVIRSHYQQ
jgi:hypothetical protein